MSTWNSALTLWLAEALALLIFAVSGWLFYKHRQNQRELDEIDTFISRLERKDEIPQHTLQIRLENDLGLSKTEIEKLWRDVDASEKALLQRVIQLFLRREMTMLNEIDRAIAQLSEPYCKLIEEMATRENAKIASAPQHDALQRTNTQLSQQLHDALETIDEITAEYARVFSGQQTVLELENSRKKMLQTFHEAEQKIRQHSQPGKEF